MNRLAFLAVFVVGALTMFLFDQWYTLALGFALQVAAVVMGAFSIATPEFLSGDSSDD